MKTAAQSWGQANEFEKAQKLEIASAAAAGPNAEQRLVNAAAQMELRGSRPRTAGKP